MTRRDQPDREPRRLRPLTLLQVDSRVQIAFFATATEVETSICLEVEGPDLVSPSHSKDNCVAIDSYNIPRTRQSLSLRRLVTLLIESFLTGSYYSEYFF